MGKDGKLNFPNHPTIPFIEGDGIGPDIWKAAVRVLDAAVEKAYNGEKKIEWLKVLAGQEAFDKTGSWMPDETMQAFHISGPMPSPSIKGIVGWLGTCSFPSLPIEIFSVIDILFFESGF